MIAKEFEEFILREEKTFLTPARNLAVLIDTHNVDHAILVLSQISYTRVPVVTDQMKYVGTISLTDILSYQMKHDYSDEVFSSMDIVHMTKTDGERLGKDYTVTEVLHKLVEESFLPVVSEDGVFEGIITRKSILKAFNSLMHNFSIEYDEEKMKEYIASFIKEKDLSENSQTAYSYDLDQFVDTVHNHVSDTNLRIYQASIKDFKPAVQKRKLSAVNQFLFYLYQHQVIEDYHRLVLPKVSVPKSHDQELLDLSLLWEGSELSQGRLIALLIVEMGLLPSEILQLKIVDIELDFQVLRVGKEGQKRVLRIPDALLGELTDLMTGTYLFDNKGKAYSRQWGFRQLESFLLEKGFENLSAQSLREQYILKQREQGMDLFSIARELGLKTLVTLEKYK